MDKIQFISNPFLNTTREHEGWRLIGQICDISDCDLDEIDSNSYRIASINNIDFREVIYVKATKPFLAQLISYISTDEFSLDGTRIVLACALELRDKKVTYAEPHKICKPTIVSKPSDLVGLVSYDNGKVITYVDKKGVIVKYMDRKIGKDEVGYRLNTNGGYYECFEKLRAEGFPVMYHDKNAKLITNFSDLEKFCNTVHLKLLLNNTEDSMMWQLEDINGVKFDFTQFLNEKGYTFINI